MKMLFMYNFCFKNVLFSSFDACALPSELFSTPFHSKIRVIRLKNLTPSLSTFNIQTIHHDHFFSFLWRGWVIYPSHRLNLLHRFYRFLSHSCRMNPNGNYGFWLIIIHQYGLINGNIPCEYKILIKGKTGGGRGVLYTQFFCKHKIP